MNRISKNNHMKTVKDPPDRLLTDKVRIEFLSTPQKALIFRPELKRFEELLQKLPRDRAHELAEYTTNYFKLKHIKTLFPPGTDHIPATEIFILDLERYLDKQKTVSIIKRVAAWVKLCELVNNQINKL